MFQRLLEGWISVLRKSTKASSDQPPPVLTDPKMGISSPPPNYNSVSISAPLESPNPHKSLAGKVVLVTGASRGIGAGIALELGSRGASIAVNYVCSVSAAESVCNQIIKTGSTAVAIKADVSKVSEITRLFKETKEKFGKIDIVCSNSGMESFDKTEDITEQKFDEVFNLNFRAQFFVAQHAYQYLQPNGRLVLMSSIAAGLISVGDHALYSASKMAVNGATKSFAKDFGERGITVNAIAPGGVKSDMFAQVAWRYIPGGTEGMGKQKVEEKMSRACPLGRCGQPEDIARVVAFLVGEDGGWVNGQVITISGGAGQ